MRGMWTLTNSPNGINLFEKFFLRTRAKAVIPSFPTTLILMIKEQNPTSHENNGWATGNVAPIRFYRSRLSVRRIPWNCFTVASTSPLPEGS